MIARHIDEVIPVCLLTGFLGAGKTTLLNHLLRHPDMAGTAVLINEFGQVGIDHHLVDAADDSMLLLSSGCVCCSMKGDLANALRRLDERAARGDIPPLRRIIIETTGLADPVPVILALREDNLMSRRFQCDSLVTVVDATIEASLLSGHQEAVRQIVMADHLLISKTDIAREHQLAQLNDWLDHHNPSAQRRLIVRGDIEPHLLFGAEASGHEGQPPRHSVPDSGHHHGGPGRHASSFTVEFPGPVDRQWLAMAMGQVLRDFGTSLLRVKGIVALLGRKRPVVIHCVRGTAYPLEALTAKSTGHAPSLGLVFIAQGLEQSAIAEIRSRLGRIAEGNAIGPMPDGGQSLPTQCWL
jgi:G3E family GTPase